VYAFDGSWDVCPGENSNLTLTINQTAIPNDPKMCRNIRMDHEEPDLAVSQFYTINPTGNDRFFVMCDMVDGGWGMINVTYVPTQHFVGGEPAQWLPQNLTYDITEQRMRDMRNISLYAQQQALVFCKSSYTDFNCPRDPYHVIHESTWLEWTSNRLWPVYAFDGCCYQCCYHTDQWRQSVANFWSLNLPIRNVWTFYGGADDNSEDLRFEMQPLMFF
jgi:hypothetical protein